MKTMTCKELGGACDQEFHANTFDEIAEMSKEHGTQMFQLGDEAHLDAMSEMLELMEKPEEMGKWYDQKRKEFNAKPEDK